MVEKTEDDDFKGAMGCGCGRGQIQCNTGKEVRNKGIGQMKGVGQGCRMGI